MLHFAAKLWLVTTLTHTQVIYEPYPSSPPTSPCVIAPICTRISCITVMCQPPLFLFTHHGPLYAGLKKVEMGGAHKDKNHISPEGACVTVIYAVSILPPH